MITLNTYKQWWSYNTYSTYHHLLIINLILMALIIELCEKITVQSFTKILFISSLLTPPWLKWAIFHKKTISSKYPTLVHCRIALPEFFIREQNLIGTYLIYQGLAVCAGIWPSLALKVACTHKILASDLWVEIQHFIHIKFYPDSTKDLRF